MRREVRVRTGQPTGFASRLDLLSERISGLLWSCHAGSLLHGPENLVNVQNAPLDLHFSVDGAPPWG